MTTAPSPNSRASLLAGLRTGGVRSASTNVPHTAAPGGSFNVPRFASQQYPSVFPEEDDHQQTSVPSNVFSSGHGVNQIMPMTAAVDGPNNRFSHQQGSRGMNPNSAPFSPAFNVNMLAQTNNAQAQALQMQMMQLEILKLQSIQAQQYQAELLAQAQRQQQSQTQTQNRRPSLALNPPATAGPLTGSFNLRSATLSAQMRRANQAEHVPSQLGLDAEDQLPMTAALGGKFGSRTSSLVPNSAMSRLGTDDDENLIPPATPNSTTVISGGTSLGNLSSNGNTTPSKSDSAASWRRGGNNNSVLSGNNRNVSSPSLKVTPPPGEQRASSPPLVTPIKTRPQPLRFSTAVSQPLPTVAIDTSVEGNDAIDNDDASSTGSGSSKSVGSNSSPTTPRSSSSNEMPLSPREEASKKLYEGLGIGRPVASVQQQQQPLPSVVSHRVVSQPMRQPRGPPSGADELGPKNFATRIRRKAIGGLGMLMGARERREFVEAY